MVHPSVIPEITDLIEPIVTEEGLKLWDVVWTTDQGRSILRVLLEKDEGGVTIDDCSRVSHSIEDLIEIKGLVNGPYSLEVSSPGLDRPLRTKGHFERCLGQVIQVSTRVAIDGRRNYKGILTDIDAGHIKMVVDQREYKIHLDQILKAKVDSLV